MKSGISRLRFYGCQLAPTTGIKDSAFIRQEFMSQMEGVAQRR